jgi:hypothetical protein
LFGYNDPDNKEPTHFPIFLVTRVYVNSGDSIEDTLGYTMYDLHYAVTTILDGESCDSNGFDLVAWYARSIIPLYDECFGLTNEGYKNQNGGCSCGATESGLGSSADESESESE